MGDRRVTPEEHLANFQEFVQDELEVGGPDTHMKITQWMAREAEDPAWFIALYTVPYVSSSGEVLAHYLPRPRPVSPEGGARLRQLIRIRKERVVNGMNNEKTGETITSLAEWFLGGGLQRAQAAGSFDAAYRVVGEVKNYGRYFNIKLYEALRGAGYLTHEMDDLRPSGGSLSRRSLELMFPGHVAKDNSKAMQAHANALGEYLLSICPGTTWFKLEAFLCNYRQLLGSSKRYSGKGHDDELTFLRSVQRLNPDIQFRTLEARAAIFNPVYLGEVQGWEGVRPSLGDCYTTLGYRWNDARYDYVKTTSLGRPVPR